MDLDEDLLNDIVSDLKDLELEEEIENSDDER
jgi:hypothetical protein